MNSNERPSVGWIGTGVMGAAMATHLQEVGYPLTVYTRTQAKAQPLLNAGARWAESPRKVAEQTDVVFSIVGFPNDVREVYLGDDGLLAGAKEEMVLVDMTTTEPSLAIEIYQRAQERNVRTIDAPVSGGDVGAKQGTLSMMVGGDQNTVDEVMPLLELMGKSIVYQGKAGAGQHTKMSNQITIASTMVGVCESLLYGYRAGLDLPTMLRSISGGAAACWTLDNLAPRVVDRNFDPGFYIEHFIKDMGIALRESHQMGLSMPGLALAHQLYEAANAQGHSKLGTHALSLALEHISNIQVESEELPKHST